MAAIPLELHRSLAFSASFVERCLSGDTRVLRDGASLRVRSADGDARVAVDPDAYHAAYGTWCAAAADLAPTGATCDPRGLALLVAGAASLACALGWNAGRPGVDLTVSPLALGRLGWVAVPHAAGDELAWGFRGFHRCDAGAFVSLALADAEEGERFRSAITVHFDPAWQPGAPLPGPAPAIAAVLQEWALACLPALPGPVFATAEHRSATTWPETPIIAERGAEVAHSRLLDLPPLATGLRVVTLGHLIAGPFAGALLAAAGADATLLYHPVRPPLDFGVPAYQARPADLSTPAGRELLGQLLHETDALIENFRPRVLPNLALIPLPGGDRLTHVALPAFPTRSARANWKTLGFALEAQLRLGLAPRPDAPIVIDQAPGLVIADYAVAMFAATAAVLCPHRREIELPQHSLLGAGARRLRRDIWATEQAIA